MWLRGRRVASSYLWQCFRKLNQRGILSCLLWIVATRLRAGWSATWISARTRDFSLCWKVETYPGGTPRILFSGYSSSFPEVRRAGREGNHSRPSSVEVKNEWSYTYTTPASPRGVDRETFTRLTDRICVWRRFLRIRRRNSKKKSLIAVI